MESKWADPTSIRLTIEQKAAIDKLAAEEDCLPAAAIRELITRGFATLPFVPFRKSKTIEQSRKMCRAILRASPSLKPLLSESLDQKLDAIANDVPSVAELDEYIQNGMSELDSMMDRLNNLSGN